MQHTSFRLVLILLFTFSIFALSVNGQQLLTELPPEIETDRPDQTEASSVISKGTVQVEAGFLYENDREENTLIESYTYPTVLVRVGLLERAEFRLIGEFNSTNFQESDVISRSNTLSPLLIGTKLAVCEEKGLLPQIAFIGHLALPIGSKENRPAYTAPLFRFSLSHTLTEKMSLGYNLGYEWDGNNPQGAFIYTLTLGRDLGEKIGAYIEVFGDIPERDPLRMLFDGGLTFRPRPNLQFDISGGSKITVNAPDYYLSTGVSFRLPH